ncbi:MAG: SBBP repeat-containing protein [Promethearchaeota archaeon]
MSNINTSIKFEWNQTQTNEGEDIGRAIVTDSFGNIYLTGKQYNSSKNAFDIYLGKYNNSGDLLWNKSWGGNSDDSAFSIDIDSLNNIYITGSTLSYTNGSVDIILIKYNSFGGLVWNISWGGIQYDCGYGIAIDNSDNIYIVGYTEIYDIFGDVIILKFNSSGYLEWNEIWGGSDTDLAYDIEIDVDENICITGYTSSFGAITSNSFLAKFNNNGEHQWNITWGAALPDNGYSLVVDSSDDILVVGNTQNYGAGGNDIVLFKFNSSGDPLWNTTWGGSEHDYGYSIALDSKENIYITGYTRSFDGIDKDVCLVKFNHNGDYMWYKIWGNSLDDIAYGITIDSFDNTFITGRTETTINDFDLFLAKYLAIPDDFELSADVSFPHTESNFTLSWTDSLDTDNYSLYQSNETITEINSNVKEIVKGNTNRTYYITNLEQCTHYFLVVAFNEYGNTSSNCLKAIIQFVPGEFTLNNHTEIPDTDGIVNFTWSTSEGADNYSVYVHVDFIYDFETQSTLVANNITDTFFLIENLTNGDYYYVIVAYNEVGDIMSNCIQVIVRRAPDPFILFSDADIPTDDDGTFDIIWTRSEYALNYTIFISNYTITTFNSSVKSFYNFTPPFEWPYYRYSVSGWGNGTYFFIVVAYNEFGNYTTGCLKIIVLIPYTPSNGTTDGKNVYEWIPITIPYIIITGLLGVLILVYYKRKKFRSK